MLHWQSQMRRLQLQTVLIHQLQLLLNPQCHASVAEMQLQPHEKLEIPLQHSAAGLYWKSRISTENNMQRVRMFDREISCHTEQVDLVTVKDAPDPVASRRFATYNLKCSI